MRTALPVALALVAGIALFAGPAGAQDDTDSQVPVPSGDEYADTDPSALSDFRAALEPYGSWQDDASYGTVWTPDASQVGSDFQPYETAGGWDSVDGDDVWVSDFAWGWVCFHYGRWAWSAGRWVWIPGREYAGAWVSWRMGDDDFQYVGWAPMAPSWIWMGGVATMLGFGTQEPWTFAGYGQLYGPGVSGRSVTGNRATPAVGRTRPFVHAQPGVGGTSAPRGPTPGVLGLDVTRLSLPPLAGHELRARQLARPSTALPLGGHAPASHVVRAVPRAAPARGFAAPSRGPAPARGRR